MNFPHLPRTKNPAPQHIVSDWILNAFVPNVLTHTEEHVSSRETGTSMKKGDPRKGGIMCRRGFIRVLPLTRSEEGYMALLSSSPSGGARVRDQQLKDDTLLEDRQRPRQGGARDRTACRVSTRSSSQFNGYPLHDAEFSFITRWYVKGDTLTGILK